MTTDVYYEQQPRTTVGLFNTDTWRRFQKSDANEKNNLY